MAIYHLSVKPVSRSSGRSVCAAAAYRSGELVHDPRQGIDHDYTRRHGVEYTEIIGFSGTRQELWGQTEQIETRKNARLAVEAELALPAELSADQRQELVRAFAGELAREYGVAVDVAIHAPGKEGDNRNHHAHLLIGCRKVEGNRLTDRVVPFDGPEQVEQWRQRWADRQNLALRQALRIERVDHRSNERRGLDAEPTRHLGPEAAAVERAARREARQQGREYQPVTGQGQHNEATRRENLRRWIERQMETVRRARAKAEKLLERVGFKLNHQAEQKEIEQQKFDAFRDRLRQAGQKVHQQKDAVESFRQKLQQATERTQEKDRQKIEQERTDRPHPRQRDRGPRR